MNTLSLPRQVTAAANLRSAAGRLESYGWCRGMFYAGTERRRVPGRDGTGCPTCIIGAILWTVYGPPGDGGASWRLDTSLPEVQMLAEYLRRHHPEDVDIDVDVGDRADWAVVTAFNDQRLGAGCDAAAVLRLVAAAIEDGELDDPAVPALRC
jgi:hypothetical protein